MKFEHGQYRDGKKYTREIVVNDNTRTVKDDVF